MHKPACQYRFSPSTAYFSEVKVVNPHILVLFALFFSALPGKSQFPDESIRELARLHTTSASMEKDSALAWHYNHLAEGFSGQRDSLAAVYIDSLAYLAGSGSWPKTQGLHLRALGKYHDRRGEFELALDYYSQAIEAFKAVGDQSDFLAYTYILKAFVLNNNGMHDACFETLNEIRPLAEKLANKNYLAWILDFHGDYNFYSAFGVQDYQQALSYYQQVEELLPGVRNNMIKADNAHGLAGCYIRLGDEQKAETYRNKALELSRAHGLHSVIFAVYGDMADVYESQGNLDKAIEYRLQSLAYAQQTGWIEMEARAQRTVANTYKSAGDFENALRHFEALHAIEDSLDRFDVQTKFHELEAKFELGEKNLEIQQLQARNLRLSLYVLGALFLGGLLFLNYYRRTNKKLVQQNTELEHKNQEIRAALTEGQHIERKRMAIELHDNINAKIAAAKWILETINTPDKTAEEQQVINRLVESMSEIYEDVRFISHNLVPKEIETRELGSIIGQLTKDINQNQRIQFSYIEEGKVYKLDPVIKIQSYAMILELINNVIKHADCTAATIHIHYGPEHLNISVEDNGKGFLPEEVRSGVGLKNIESRVKSVNGTMSISKGHNKGVRIAISIPRLAMPEAV